MKRSTVAAIIIAVLLIATFVTLKFYRNNPSPSFSIIGEWQLDSAYAPTGASDSVRLLTEAMNEAAKTDHPIYQFLADSTLKRRSAKDDISEKYYLRDSVLYIAEHSEFLPFPFTAVSDSLIRFSNADSVVFILKKK